MSTRENDGTTPAAARTEPAEPKSLWSRIVATTPIVLTVLATIFAGISSSEMTQSMYFRSLAAQHQSKAGDQWGFFQAKRIRGTSLEATVDVLQAVSFTDRFDAERVSAASTELVSLMEAAEKKGSDAVSRAKAAAEKLQQLVGSESGKSALHYLLGPDWPTEGAPRAPAHDGAVEAVLQAIRQRQTEVETAETVRHVSVDAIDRAIIDAETAADAFDKAIEPVLGFIREVRKSVDELAAAARELHAGKGDDASQARQRAGDAVRQLSVSFKSAVLEFDARRYRQESAYNRSVAELYEVRVRRSGVESDRHRERSKKFFYSMLMAQAGVTIASLALAKSRRSVLWLLAAMAGAAALAFSSYVYLT